MGYNLLVKKHNWSNTYKLVNNISYTYLRVITTEIKVTNKYTNSDIIKLECEVQTIASRVPYLYARCLEPGLILKVSLDDDSYLAI